MDMTTSRPVALLFAGQGNPTIGMGADLWDRNEMSRAVWDCASDISGGDIRRICLKGPMNKLIQTTHQQVAVTAINVTLYMLCKDTPAAASVLGACGHSVGEYAALYAAGAVTLEDLFKMIHFRSQLMNELSKERKGTMLAVKGVDYQTMVSLIADAELDICCDNSRRQQVIGGEPNTVSEFSRLLTSLGYNTTKLGVNGAWHTRLMADGVARMRDFLADIPIERPRHEVLMNVTGRPESDPAAIKENLSLHLTHTVKWTASVEHFLLHPLSPLFIEVSNKAYLGHMLNDFTGFAPEMVSHCRNILL